MPTLQLTGFAELQAYLNRVARSDPLTPALRRTMLHMGQKLGSDAPSPRRGARRTGRMQDAWRKARPKIQRSQNRLRGELANPRHYWIWVQRHQTQHDSNKSRWKTDKEIFEREMPAIRAIFDQEIKRVLEG